MKNLTIILIIVIATISSLTAQNLEWVKSLSGDNDFANTIKIVTDLDENAYILGTFFGTIDFDPGDDIFELTTSNSGTSFLLKLDESGNFVWVKTLHGSTDIEIDNLGNLTLFGNFINSIDFDPGNGVHILTSLGTNEPESYILRLNSSGEFIWVKQTDRIGNISMKIDFGGNIFITGNFSYTTYFMHPSNTLTADLGNMFILKLNSQGNYLWVKQYGSSSENIIPSDIDVDSEGNILIAGNYNTFYITSGASIISTDEDIFLNKYAPNGNLISNSLMGGDGIDKAYALTIDNSNNVYLAGNFNGSAMLGVLGGGTKPYTADGSYDLFLLKYNFSTYEESIIHFRSHSPTKGYSLSSDNDGNVYSTGYFYSNIYINSNGIGKTLYTTSLSTFIYKIDSLGDIKWGTKIVNLTDSRSISISNKYLYITGLFGQYTKIIDFNPDENKTETIENTGISDSYILKLNTEILATNINEPVSENNLNIENPSNGKIKIDLSSFNLSTVKIYDTNGQEHFPNTKNTNQLEFDLAKGIYFVSEIKNSKVINTRKLLIQ